VNAPETPEVVDARGLRCPLPVIRLAAAARDGSPGDLLTVWSTDPAARHDVPAWARMRGHAVIESVVLPSGTQSETGPDDVTTWAVTVRLGG
jgi:tRNA 2-thiouridine synthesizing protein A